MSISLKIFLFIVVVLFLLIIFSLLKKGTLKIKYSIMCIFMSLALVIVFIFNKSIEKISMFFGFENTSNFIFFIAILFILLIIVSLSSTISNQSEKIKTLSQKLGILEERVRKVEDKNDDKI